MKKLSLLLIAVLAFQFQAIAQDEAEKTVPDFNKWSIDLTGGVNKPVRPVSSGFFTNTPSLFTVTGGVRYMLNKKSVSKLALHTTVLEMMRIAQSLTRRFITFH